MAQPPENDFRDARAAGESHVVALRMTSNLLREAGFVVGGRGLPAQLQPRPGLDLCHRVSEVVEAVDALIKRPERN